ncbi:MAG: nuclear transport factor 2 family protein [Armatimonas sp.]
MTTHNNQSDIQVVQGIYEAFSRGDVPAILSEVTEDAHWCNLYGQHLFPGHWGKPAHNHEEIKDFFRVLSEEIEVHSLEPQEFLAERGRVVVILRWRGVARRTGRSFDTMLVHLWTVKDGKVVEYIGLDDPTAYGF